MLSKLHHFVIKVVLTFHYGWQNVNCPFWNYWAFHLHLQVFCVHWQSLGSSKSFNWSRLWEGYKTNKVNRSWWRRERDSANPVPCPWLRIGHHPSKLPPPPLPAPEPNPFQRQYSLAEIFMHEYGAYRRIWLMLPQKQKDMAGRILRKVGFLSRLKGGVSQMHYSHALQAGFQGISAPRARKITTTVKSKSSLLMHN